MIDTAQMRNRIQAEIDNHLAIVAALQEKLALVGQVESLANELGLKGGDHSQKVAPDAKPEASSSVSPPTEESVVNPNKMLWKLMHHAFQTYQAGMPDKALELFRDAREQNPDGFEKTWTTMTALPTYSSVARDKYFTESLFSE